MPRLRQRLSIGNRSSSCQQEQGDIQSHDDDQQNPFSIPELLYILASCMDRPTKVTSLQVSIMWYRTIVPLLWTETSSYLSLETPQPPFPVVKKHAHLIRKLELCGHVSECPLGSFPTCPNLTKLVITWPSDHENKSRDFIRRHKGTLTSALVESRTSTDLLESLIDCPNLKELKLGGLHLVKNDRWMDLYERLWSRLEVLHLLGSWCTPPSFQFYPRVYYSPSDTTLKELASRTGPSTLKKVIIDYGMDDEVNEAMLKSQFFVLQQSPDLVRIQWSHFWKDRRGGPLQLMANEVRAGGSGWRQLESLIVPMTVCDPEDFEVLIRMMPKVVQLRFYSSDFNVECWRRLQRVNPQHLITIRTLNLGACVDVPGSAVHEMLCSMPNLVNFNAWYIRDTDILEDDRPWACRGSLRVLTLAFRLESRSSQSMVFSRLSELVELREWFLWDLASWDGCCPANQELRLTLKEGLDQLSTLKRLEILAGPTGPSGNIRWGPEEEEWVRVHWPKLEEIHAIDRF